MIVKATFLAAHETTTIVIDTILLIYHNIMRVYKYFSASFLSEDALQIRHRVAQCCA